MRQANQKSHDIYRPDKARNPKKGPGESFFEDTKSKRVFLLETESYYYKEKRSRKKWATPSS